MNEKKPITPYFCFLLQMKEQVKVQHKEVSNIELNKIAVQMWHEMPDCEKEKWREQALNRAIQHKQNTDYQFLKVLHPNYKKKKGKIQIVER